MLQLVGAVGVGAGVAVVVVVAVAVGAAAALDARVVGVDARVDDADVAGVKVLGVKTIGVDVFGVETVGVEVVVGAAAAAAVVVVDVLVVAAEAEAALLAAGVETALGVAPIGVLMVRLHGVTIFLTTGSAAAAAVAPAAAEGVVDVVVGVWPLAPVGGAPGLNDNDDAASDAEFVDEPPTGADSVRESFARQRTKLGLTGTGGATPFLTPAPLVTWTVAVAAAAAAAAVGTEAAPVVATAAAAAGLESRDLAWRNSDAAVAAMRPDAGSGADRPATPTAGDEGADRATLTAAAAPLPPPISGRPLSLRGVLRQPIVGVSAPAASRGGVRSRNDIDSPPPLPPDFHLLGGQFFTPPPPPELLAPASSAALRCM